MLAPKLSAMRLLVAISICMVVFSAAHAAEPGLPVGTLRIIVPWLDPSPAVRVTAGAGSIARFLSFMGQELEKSLVHPVVIQYRERSQRYGNQIEGAAKAYPDGNTMMIGHLRLLVLQPIYEPQLKYDVLRDFSAVLQLAVMPRCWVIPASAGESSVDGWIRMAKARDTPARFATIATGFTDSVFVEMLSKVAEVRLTMHSSSKGWGAQMKAVASGSPEAAFVSCRTLRRSGLVGALRILAVSGNHRSADYPLVPTLKESGIPVDLDDWIGMFAPSETPQEIVERVAAATAKVIRSERGQELLSAAGGVPTGILSSEFQGALRRDVPRWRAVVEAADWLPEVRARWRR